MSHSLQYELKETVCFLINQFLLILRGFRVSLMNRYWTDFLWMQTYIFVFLHGPSATAWDWVTYVVWHRVCTCTATATNCLPMFQQLHFFIFSYNMKKNSYLVSSLPDISRTQRLLVGKVHDNGMASVLETHINV